MTNRERIQWAVLIGLVGLLLLILIWNMLLPGNGDAGRIPVIDEVLRRRR
jgi:hypothetical protein